MRGRDDSRIEGGVSHLYPGRNGVAHIRRAVGLMQQASPKVVTVATSYEVELEDGSTMYGNTYYPHFLPEPRRVIPGPQLWRMDHVAQQFDGTTLHVESVTSVVPLVEIEEERSGGAVAYSPGEGVLVALETRTGLAIARPPDRLFLDGASAVSVAPDRLRGGTLVLHRGPDGRFELGHLRWGGSFELVRRAALGEHEPAGSLASNETEALVPLRDGSMLFVVLSHFEQRVTEPVEPGGVDAMEIVLRPGESAGGLLYTHRLASGESRLVFRSLVCNR